MSGHVRTIIPTAERNDIQPVETAWWKEQGNVDRNNPGTDKILYLINPAGHGGIGTKAWEQFKALWTESVDPKQVIVTQRRGHAREIAAGSEGYDILVVVGGDGTVGEVMSGMMDRAEPPPALAIIPGGTGNDIARNVGVHTVEEGVTALRNGITRGYDLLRVDHQEESHPAHSYGFLAGVVGFSAIPMVKPWMKRLLGPKGAYYLGTILQIIAFRPPRMTIRTEETARDEHNWMVIVGNAERTAGGSMCLAPGAQLDDGELNVTIFPAGSKWKMAFRMLPKIASGTHVDEPDVSYFPARQIAIDSTPPAIVELDGDLLGTTPATFTVCPRAVRIVSRK